MIDPRHMPQHRSFRGKPQRRSAGPSSRVILDALLGEWENGLRLAAQKIEAGRVVEGTQEFRQIIENIATLRGQL